MTHYATKFFGAVKRWAGEVASKFSATAARWLGKACGCFDADTPVWTTTGPVSIQDINVGDDVLATDETTGELSLRKVLKKYVRAAAPIVVVTMVSMANGAETSLRTTEDHPFFVVAEAAKRDQHDDAGKSVTLSGHTRSQAGWTRVGVLRPGSLVDTLEGVARVVRLQFTDELKPVYNFEIEGVHTYHVGIDGVLVHNGGMGPTSWWCNPAEVLKLVRQGVPHIRAWFGTTVQAARAAGPPPVGMTRDIAWAYVKKIRESLAKKQSQEGQEIAEARLEQLIKHFGDPGN